MGKAFPVVSKIPDPKTGDVLAGTDGKIKGKVVVAVAKKDADKGEFPLKDKDAAMGAAFAYLRSKGAFPDDDGDDHLARDLAVGAGQDVARHGVRDLADHRERLLNHLAADDAEDVVHP